MATKTKKFNKKNYIISGTLLFLVVAFFTFKPSETIFTKQAVFGSTDLTYKTYETGKNELAARFVSPIYLDLTDRSRALTLNQMGAYLNETELKKFTMRCKSRFLPIFCSRTTPRNDLPNKSSIILLDSNKVEQTEQELLEMISFMKGNNIVSFEKNEFMAISPQAQLAFVDNLADKNVYISFLSNDETSVTLETKISEDDDSQTTLTQNLIKNISIPLLIKFGREPIYIPATTTADFIGTTTDDGLLKGYIKEDKIKAYLSEISPKYENDDVKLLFEEAVDAIKRAMLFRAANYEINNAVILPLEGKARTNGELHDVYLEVNKSQQRLYRFEGGELVKTYIISTGLTWETPPGEYKVLGKQKMTISYYDSWWMPNYLRIGDINGYNFGFHAIPYHMDGAGNIYSRDPNTMGSPATGGCIQLTEDDSLELFEWAEIGTPVYIFE